MTLLPLRPIFVDGDQIRSTQHQNRPRCPSLCPPPPSSTAVRHATAAAKPTSSPAATPSVCSKARNSSSSKLTSSSQQTKSSVLVDGRDAAPRHRPSRLPLIVAHGCFAQPV
uniref:Uncharacterized protein n=1 Tax=Oryza sativa subsp. japonica TaxID=39947 RepID=Q6EUS7_ORYSJ|nr:hypothetical protein [Oryza sativa Japonica Group]